MKKLIISLAVISICLVGCATEKTMSKKPTSLTIIEGQTTVTELEQVLGKPSFLANPTPPDTGKLWVYVSWKRKVGSSTSQKTIRKVLIKDGIVVKHSVSTTTE